MLVAVLDIKRHLEPGEAHRPVFGSSAVRAGLEDRPGTAAGLALFDRGSERGSEAARTPLTSSDQVLEHLAFERVVTLPRSIVRIATTSAAGRRLG